MRHSTERVSSPVFTRVRRLDRYVLTGSDLADFGARAGPDVRQRPDLARLLQIDAVFEVPSGQRVGCSREF